MKIREATLADLPRLVEMAEHFHANSPYRETYGTTRARLADLLTGLVTRADAVVFVAETAAGVPVGMIGAQGGPDLFSGERMAYEIGWWMEPAWRGHGVALLRVLEAWARGMGFVRLQMSAPTAQVETVYARLGYVRAESVWVKTVGESRRVDESDAIVVLDDVVPDPLAYRTAALAQPFRSVAVGRDVFHGLALSAPTDDVWTALHAARPSVQAPTFSCFRSSPEGQQEPHFIHTDHDLGDWTGILYLTPQPAAGDGTDFWRHRATGQIRLPPGAPDQDHWDVAPDRWIRWHHVAAVFNRLVVFPSGLFHSRALFNNYGTGETARLIQILFGSGSLAGSPLRLEHA